MTAATQVEKPDGHLPYRLFTYADRGRAAFVRPEQVVGSTVDYRNEYWIVEITLRDNLMELNSALTSKVLHGNSSAGCTTSWKRTRCGTSTTRH